MKRKAFTLIELLVVITIIALLMAILMPALQRIKKQARSVACLSRLKQWGVLFAMYADDHDGRFMAFTVSREWANWVGALGDYYKWDDEFTCCPNATKPWYDEFGVDSGARGTKVGVTMAWGYGKLSRWPKRMKGSYGINGWCNDPEPGVPPERGGLEYFWRGPNVAGAGYVPLFLDAQRLDGWALHTDRPPSFSGEIFFGVPSVGRSPDDTEMGRYCLNRHDGFAGCLFLDYSARKVGLKELWTLKWHKEYVKAGPWTLGGGAQPSEWPEWMRSFKDY